MVLIRRNRATKRFTAEAEGCAAGRPSKPDWLALLRPADAKAHPPHSPYLFR
jgi:hypothetical protein